MPSLILMSHMISQDIHKLIGQTQLVIKKVSKKERKERIDASIMALGSNFPNKGHPQPKDPRIMVTT